MLCGSIEEAMGEEFESTNIFYIPAGNSKAFPPLFFPSPPCLLQVMMCG